MRIVISKCFHVVIGDGNKLVFLQSHPFKMPFLLELNLIMQILQRIVLSMFNEILT